MFRKVVSGLCRNRRGVILVAGAIGVLTGVEHLLSTRTPKVTAPIAKPPSQKPLPAEPVSVQQTPRIKISQTRSELGYVYWVVRETGGEPSYALFDSWQEAMEEAARRMHASKNVAPEQGDSALVIA
jgi:hypothetical protein